MTTASEQVAVVMAAMRGARVDRRLMVACNIVGALQQAGMLAYPLHDEKTPTVGREQ